MTESIEEEGTTRPGRPGVDDLLRFAGAALVISLLLLSTRIHFLLFHVLVELFGVVVGATIFTIAWNGRRITGNRYLTVLGIASLFIALTDLLHTVTYKGMNLVAPAGANLPTQLWLAGRFLLAAAFLAAPLALRRPSLKPWQVLAAFGAVTALLLWPILGGDLFPAAYLDGGGLTPFKKASEYVVIGALAAALAMLFRRRGDFDATVLRFLALSMAMHISAGLLFTVYVDVYDLSNRAGHLFKLGAYLFLYQAMVVTTITNPFKLLFREAQRRESEIRRTNEELTALYRISTTLNRTMDLTELGSRIIETVTGLDILHIEPRGALFLVEGGRLRLLGERGHRESFCAGHQTLDYGTCLCGLAAVRGEIVVSANSRTDGRHTLSPDEPPHGHLILPLKAPDLRVVGVLCLYRRPDLAIDESTRELLIALGSQLGIAIQNARLYEEAREHSLRDPLTGLANRRFLNIFLERSIADAKRFGVPFSVAMLDIDNFKQYNDSLGHASGDAVLVGLARLAASATRDTDLVARYGGEEFLFLLPKIDPEVAFELAERLRKKAEERLGITVSIGIAGYRSGISADELIAQADRALYEAKRGGRNRTYPPVRR